MKMNKSKSIIITIILAVLTIFSLNYKIIFANEINKKDFTNSSAEIILDAYSNRILYAKNIHEKKFMASTTKILTAITVIENSKLDSVVEVDKSTTGIEGSSIYLEAGERLTVKELLYGLMLRSGNDVAETLAKFVSGSNEKFACLMNEMAQILTL